MTQKNQNRRQFLAKKLQFCYKIQHIQYGNIVKIIFYFGLHILSTLVIILHSYHTQFDIKQEFSNGCRIISSCFTNRHIPNLLLGSGMSTKTILNSK